MATIQVQRIHGKNTRILAQVGGTGTMYDLGGISTIDIPRTTDRADVTSFGDGNKTSVKGYADADVTGSGFYDINDSVMAALKNSATPSYFWIYPNYANANYTKFYWVPGDIEFGFHSEANAPATIPGIHIHATSTVIDNL